MKTPSQEEAKKTCLNFTCPERECVHCGCREGTHPIDACKRFKGGKCTAGDSTPPREEAKHCELCAELEIPCSECVCHDTPPRTEESCHCGKDGHPLNSINCPMHSKEE